MSDLTDEELCARVAQLDAGATAGPWTHYGDDLVAKHGELLAQALRGGSRQLPIQSNRAFIAESRTLMPEAIKRLTAANSTRAKLEEENERLRAENEILVRATSMPATQLAELHLRNERRLVARIRELESALSPSPAPTEG